MSNPYQPGPAGYAVPHPQGTTVLVLGIVGFVVCPVVSIVALVQARRALTEIDANPAAYTNRPTVVIGRVLSIVALALWALLIVFYLVVFVILGVATSRM